MVSEREIIRKFINYCEQTENCQVIQLESHQYEYFFDLAFEKDNKKYAVEIKSTISLNYSGLFERLLISAKKVGFDGAYLLLARPIKIPYLIKERILKNGIGIMVYDGHTFKTLNEPNEKDYLKDSRIYFEDAVSETREKIWRKKEPTIDDKLEPSKVESIENKIRIEETQKYLIDIIIFVIFAGLFSAALWDTITLSYSIVSIDIRFFINILIIISAIAAFILMFRYIKKKISIVKSS